MTNIPSEVVVFCPLPPKPNGIADYFVEQIPYFCRTTKVTVVIENMHPEPEGIAPNVNILRLEEYLWQQAELASVPHIYHVGNNPDTQYMLPVLLSKPGLVVVHDLNLHYLIDLTNLSQGDKLGYQHALTNNYGSAGTTLGKQLDTLGWKGRFMPHELMMNASIITAAERILVHSQYSAEKILALGHKNVCVVPHHFSPASRKYQPKLKMQYRGEFGLPGNKPVITSMGFIAKAKQIKSVLSALAAIKRSGVDFTYVLAGQCKPHEYDVYQDIADSGLQDNVIVTGFLDEDAFFKYMLSSDFIVNLRYPTGGESSGTLTRAMGMGLCCVVVNIGPFGELPDDCAVKLDWGEEFDDNLYTALDKLIRDKVYRVSLGKNAQKWIERTHNIATTTTAYLEEANKLSHSQQLEKRSFKYRQYRFLPEYDVRKWRQTHSIDTEKNNLWWEANLLPIGESKVLSISDENEYNAEIITSLFGYETPQVDSLATSLLRGYNAKAKYPLILVDVLLSDISAEPVLWLSKLNEVAELGAKLVISFRVQADIYSDYSIDRSSLSEMIEAAGFSVEKAIAGPLDIDMNNNERTNNEYWVYSAKKRSSMVNLNPPIYKNGMSELKWMYDSQRDSGGENVA
ncbi:glycosyltransferase family 4 protein [Alteromonas sp. KUL49]|uniref:glycosyltransferase family 4 protein n=1 Tax=Alteromonas sp. KUL49 TaxID=2480798 RepID=UPI00102EE4CF|nr:glycosyltransferase family 4 protein [Alteromonas sp. KUL49]TAP37884.1 glycosyltransferase [Alteromonas sp. KUL49]GEA12744.1 hypothetical protein KUL49_31190 [Alteromonas sp. KUL49]